MVYLISVFASKVGGVHHLARIEVAGSEAEAKGIALTVLEESHPRSDGWGDYDVVVTKLNRESLQHYLDNTDQ